MRTINYIAMLVSMMVNAVVFGAGAIVILAVPALNEHAKYLLPAWIVGYRYGDATYRLVLNGHSGAGHGEVPRGKIQGWLAKALAWS